MKSRENAENAKCFSKYSVSFEFTIYDKYFILNLKKATHMFTLWKFIGNNGMCEAFSTFARKRKYN